MEAIAVRGGELGDGRPSPGGGAGGTPRALVIDGDDIARRRLASDLKDLGCAVVSVASASAALNALRRQPFDIAFCDLAVEGEGGLDLLPRLIAERPPLQVVMLTASGSLDTAVAALHRGARDYLPKPAAPARLQELIREACPDRALQGRLRSQPGRAHARARVARLRSASRRMQAVLQLVERAAARDVDVLVRGEDGAGKSVVARALHGRNRGRPGPLVVVSCTSLSEDLLAREIFGDARGDCCRGPSSHEGRVLARPLGLHASRRSAGRVPAGA